MNKLTLHDLAVLEKFSPEMVADFVKVVKSFNEHIKSPDMVYGLTIQESKMLENRQKIKAIKAVRDRTSMSLADAKNFVEEAQKRMGMDDLGYTDI